VVAAAALSTVLSLAGCASSPRASGRHTQHPGSPTPGAQPAITLTDASLTPQGWVPVDFGRAQISVPPTWRVAVDPCIEAMRDTVLLGGFIGYCAAGQRAASSVAIEPYHRPVGPSKVLRVNGFRVIEDVVSATYTVPVLGVVLDFFGRTDRRVLDTLTRSPRAVALRRGPAPVVPTTWRRLTFAGVEVAVPGGWAASRTAAVTDGAPPCQPPIVLDTANLVVLSTGTRPAPVYHCPAERWPGPRVSAPRLGVVVNAGTGFDAPSSSAATDCWNQHGLRICVDSGWQLGILRLVVSRQPTAGPGMVTAMRPDIITIGLAGSGLVDRTILRSLGAAAS
jgi:hypothetical protein